MASGDSVIVKIDGDDSGFRKSLEGIGDVAQKGLGIVTKGVAAAGAALVTATGYAVNFANNVKKASNDFQAATGIAGEAAQGFEDAMLRIYNNNFGESLEDISDAMATVAQTTQEMDPSKIEGMTQNALALRDTFGFDIQEQIRAANMLMDQFGVTGEEAFNLIAQGAQGRPG